jgi:hypothetical protein
MEGRVIAGFGRGSKEVLPVCLSYLLLFEGAEIGTRLPHKNGTLGSSI